MSTQIMPPKALYKEVYVHTTSPKRVLKPAASLRPSVSLVSKEAGSLSVYTLTEKVFCEKQNSIALPVLKPMPRRAIILIVGFWAFLTIITPTLVLWSKYERERLQHSSGEERVEIKARKMMEYPERLHLTFALLSLPLPPPELQSSKPSPSPPSRASSPSPSPASSPGSSPPSKDSVIWD